MLQNTRKLPMLLTKRTHSIINSNNHVKLNLHLQIRIKVRRHIRNRLNVRRRLSTITRLSSRIKPRIAIVIIRHHLFNRVSIFRRTKNLRSTIRLRLTPHTLILNPQRYLNSPINLLPSILNHDPRLTTRARSLFKRPASNTRPHAFYQFRLVNRNKRHILR